MFSLEKEIKESGLIIVDSRNVGETDILIADNVYNDSVIARYLFFMCNKTSWHSTLQNAALDNLVQEIYFTQHSDLSWNLYLVAVMEPNDFAGLSMYDKLEFLRDTEFTRKLIVPCDHFSEIIPVGRIITQNQTEEAILPIQNWEEILYAEGLSNAWLDKPNENILDEFLKTGVDKVREQTTEKNFVTQGREVQEICSIDIPQDFRPHCYANDITLNFPRVCLFCGPNGVGKTSILEAIELAMTGGVRKSSKNPSKDRPVKLLVKTDSETATISSKFDLPERKRREEEWYACHSDSWQRSQLPSLFHTYNQFSVEDVYLYVKGDGQPEYSQQFSQMLFGSETIHCQRHWQEYIEDIDKKKKGFKREIQSLRERLCAIDDYPSTERSALEGYLIHSDFNFDIKALDLPETVCAAIDQIKPYYDKLNDKLRDSGNWSESTCSPNLMIQRREELDKLEKLLQAKKAALTDKINQLENVYQREWGLQKKQEELQQDLDQLSNLPTSVTLLQFLKENPDFTLKYQQLQTEVIEAQEIWNKYRAFSSEFLDLKTYSAPQITLEQAEEEYRSKNEQEQIIVEKLKDQDRLIRQAQETTDALNKTMAEIRSAGLRYLELRPDIEGCPLCGNPINAEQIYHYLNTATDLQSNKLTNLLNARQAIQSLYDHQKSVVSEAESQVHFLHRIQEAWQYAIKIGLAEKNDEKQVSMLLSYVKKLIADEKRAEQKYLLADADFSFCWDSLGSNKQLGTKETFLSDLKEACQSTRSILQAMKIKILSDSPAELYYAISKSKEEKSEFLLQVNLDLEAMRSEISNLEHIIPQERTYTQEIAQQVDKVKENLNRLDNLNTLWRKAFPYLKPETLRKGSLDWGRQLPELRQLAVSCIQSNQLAKEKKEIQSRINDLEQRCINADRLWTTLNRLRPAEEYSKEFIKDHLHQISNIFMQLHTPQEYTGLILKRQGEKEYLYAVRDTESKNVVPLEEMSTGQQTSVVLSVLMEMHLSMHSVPKFLLIDEPVSNVDDLNILSMLDFFRELVISQHRQLFVTTANQNVAKLFRRKFSFLEEDYSEFNIQRTDEMRFDIIVRKYNQKGILTVQRG